MLHFIHAREPNPHFLPKFRPFRINTLRTQFRPTPVFPTNYAFPPGGGGACPFGAGDTVQYKQNAMSLCPVFSTICAAALRTRPLFSYSCATIVGWGVRYAPQKSNQRPLPPPVGVDYSPPATRPSPLLSGTCSHVDRNLWRDALPKHRDCFPVPKLRDLPGTRGVRPACHLPAAGGSGKRLTTQDEPGISS